MHYSQLFLIKFWLIPYEINVIICYKYDQTERKHDKHKGKLLRE